ncbi:MAG: DUF2489 domain-containing protein [Alteromonas sp.]|uniref:DUF2489 domain-containing protein n=1 Tax=Alteromonas sp. RW2A1 TaxID=1917158 RepID=UPI0009033DF5|nr:DUF2489 domain-containing protein [Alteromonas sp. RW2A1]APE04367.1 hypothetical protein BM528_00060 [Alteromonas sp. RW2A1]MAI64044.1 DUF2489 domain-containing protein [Alteromonas sp.]
MLWVVLTGFALVVILGLGFYAGRLLFLLKQQKKRKNDATNARVANITESIILISKAMEQQQCDLSEGVIRIVNLLNALPLNNPPDFKAKFPHTHALFVEISGFAVLEARQQLSKQERRKQDKAREQIESEYESKVLDELPGVKTFCEALV